MLMVSKFFILRYGYKDASSPRIGSQVNIITSFSCTSTGGFSELDFRGTP